MKKLLGYVLALLPLAGSLLVVFYYWLLAPVPKEPPNITLRGTEIVFPIFLGILITLACIIKIPFTAREGRKVLWIWAGLAVSPLCLLLAFLWVVVPMIR